MVGVEALVVRDPERPVADPGLGADRHLGHLAAAGRIVGLVVIVATGRDEEGERRPGRPSNAPSLVIENFVVVCISSPLLVVGFTA